MARVRNLGMELNPVEAAFQVRHRGNGRIAAFRRSLEARGKFGHLVSVAHPDVKRTAQAAKKRRIADDPGRGVAELAPIRTGHLATELGRHGLHSVADTENRHPGIEQGLRDARRQVLRDRLRATGKDDALGSELANRSVVEVERVDFAVHAVLANPARDELRGLRAEVYDENAVAEALRVHLRLKRRDSSAVPWSSPRRGDGSRRCQPPTPWRTSAGCASRRCRCSRYSPSRRARRPSTGG